jgi:hypothetical protein
VRRGGLAAAIAAAAAIDAHAARPMVTDDARIVDAKACQLETWTRRTRDGNEYWALPACDFTGNLELTFGGGRTHSDEGNGFTDNILQAKTMVKPLESGGWGMALTLGTARHPQREAYSGWPGDPYFNVPVSFSTMEDRWVAHFNAGASYRRDEKRTVGTWGFGHEIQLRDDLYLIPEIFHSDPGRPFFQAGLRYWIVKDRIQLDATYGNRFVSEDQHWFSIGLRLLTPAFIR